MAKDKKKSKRKTVEEMPAVTEPKRTTSSPVYPAVTSESQKALEVIQEDQPGPAPTQAEKTHRKGKAAASWAAKAGGVIVTAIISGFSSYQSSKSDQEGSYTATVTAVKELQDAVKELAKQQAYTQGQLDALRNEASKLHGTKTTVRPPPPELKAKVLLSELPTDYGEVVKRKGKPMMQQAVDLAPMDADGIFDADEKAVLNDTEKKRALALEELQKRRDAEKKAAEEKHPAAPSR